MNDRPLYRYLSLALLLGTFFAFAQAQAPAGYTGIYAFTSSQGNYPDSPDLLAQGTDGLLYGTLPAGAMGNRGEWFQYEMSGPPILYQMGGNTDSSTGPLSPDTGLSFPHSGFMLGIDGNFYGAAPTVSGQAYGALFKMWGGTVTTVFSFSDGPGTGPNAGPTSPVAPPVQALDGNLYGVTVDGANTGWIYQVILNANGSAGLGWHFQLPSGSTAPLFLANDGNLYGTYSNGSFSWGSTTSGVVASSNGNGGIFGVSTAGVVTWFYNLNPFNSSFPGGDGQNPLGPVMQAADGNLYGTASGGGANGSGQGVVYKIGRNGTGYTPIFPFQAATGTSPQGGLVQGSDGYLYGLTSANGTLTRFQAMQGMVAKGTLFKLQPNGANFTPLFTFMQESSSNSLGPGAMPLATPVLHTNGSIYGLTKHGGFKTNYDPNISGSGVPDDTGEFFSYNAGLSPFISVVGQRSAHVGDRITIIGQGFSTATGITFGGVAGSWVKFNPTIWNDTSMTVTVPMGAKPGVITVLEPTGNLSTLYNFTYLCSGPFCNLHIR